MNTTQKLAVGFGIASGALLTALLMSGRRGSKAKSYLVRGARTLRNRVRGEVTRASVVDEPEVHYI
ncbi:MAG: hypothetical protein DIU61_013405 [Bacteroidota bacterium]|nr:MAG: hypothetical protein DIU61_18350 [Bacteroidota bacterium]